MKMNKKSTGKPPALDFNALNRICDRAYFMALKMIDIANHHRPDPGRGEPKVGGHPTACASSQHILTAIHMVTRQAEDYIACKPHVSPMDHALNFLLHNFRNKDGSTMSREDSRLAMSHLRHYSSEGEPVFQSYHAEADPDNFRFFPSGSVGIPPVNALYTALGYQFAKDHGYELNEDPAFWCLMGDSEFREGSLMEAMPDAGDRQLNRVIWIVDYNRQNLDGTRVLNEKAMGGTDADRIVRLAEANGWRAIKLKHGKIRERLFLQPGGDEFRRVLDETFSDFEFQALLSANNPALTRKTLIEKSSRLKSFLKNLSDEDLQRAFLNLAGHDLEILVEAFQKARASQDRPTLIVPYTIKGYGLQAQAMSGNHSAVPDAEELKAIAAKIGASDESPFEDFEDGSPEEDFLKARREVLVPGIDSIIQQSNERREKYQAEARAIDWPVDFGVTALKFNPVAHTQWMWGQVAAKLDRLSRDSEEGKSSATPTEEAWKKVSHFFVTMAPDVGSSTNTSPNMNGKLYGDIGQEDFETTYDAKDAKAPDVIPHANARTGHIRFEIAEGNCMSAAGSFGKFKYFTGLPFYPAMTIYDFFIKRAHDQLYYNLYWHSNFATIGTPSGVTLAPEGAQHSWKSDFQIPHCVTWEPCFAKELEWILADTLRRHFTGDDEEREAALIRCVTKGVVQKEFMDRLQKQIRFADVSEDEIWETIRKEVLQGGYALVDYRGFEGYEPGDNVVHLFAMGALVPEAVKASDLLLARGIFANVFVVTSSDLLLGNFAYHNGYSYLKETLGVTGDLFLLKNGEMESEADWFTLQGNRVPIVSVHDGEPGLLDNIGSIVGVKHHTLAVRKTSKSGTTKDIFHLHNLDAEAIVDAAKGVLIETAAEKFRISSSLLQTLLK